MIAETQRPIIEQVHSNGRNGHGIPLTELSPGIKVPEFIVKTSLEQIFADNLEIEERAERLDYVSKRWIGAKLSGDSESINEFWKIQAEIAGVMLRGIIRNVTFPRPIGDEIGKMYENLKREGEGDITVAVRSPRMGENGADLPFARQNIIFLQKGKNGVIDTIREYLADRFVEEEVMRRNEARLKMIQGALRDNPEDIGAWQKSEVLSHAKSNFAVVVQRR